MADVELDDDGRGTDNLGYWHTVTPEGLPSLLERAFSHAGGLSLTSVAGKRRSFRFRPDLMEHTQQYHAALPALLRRFHALQDSARPPAQPLPETMGWYQALGT